MRRGSRLNAAARSESARALTSSSPPSSSPKAVVIPPRRTLSSRWRHLQSEWRPVEEHTITTEQTPLHPSSSASQETTTATTPAQEKTQGNTNPKSVLTSSSSLTEASAATMTNGQQEEGPILIPQFAYSELTLGRIVGQGGFSVVSEILSMDLDDVYDTNATDTKARKDFCHTVNRTGSRHRYVLKTLRTDLPVEEHVKGVVDLAIEADFLRQLRHDNIISMRAVANTDPRDNRYFVILDRLGMTLDRKFNYWRKLVGENSGYWIPICGYCCSNAPALHALWKERLETALSIARAIQHLHSQKIVYRDIKPDNLGFDAATGTTVKLFDFGLAKRLQTTQRADGRDNTQIDIHDSDCLYLLTGNTGSLRYMAPEVAMDQPYNLSCDAYSFGILFWQLCSLQTPFAGFSERMHADKVVRQGQRPRPDRSWPYSWVQLQQHCWNAVLQQRPAFDVIVQELQDRVNELVDDDGVIPSRASDIRAKKRKMKRKDDRLDVDTRLAGMSGTNSSADGGGSNGVVAAGNGAVTRSGSEIV